MEKRLDTTGKLALSDALAEMQDRLYAYLFSLTAGAQETADLLQETNFAILSKADQYDPQYPFWPWFKGFALNAVRHWRNSQRQETVVFNSELVDQLSETVAGESEGKKDGGNVYQSEAYARYLAACMKKLPDWQQSLMNRRYANGEKVSELAGVFHLSAVSLSNFLYHLRQALKRCIQKMEKGSRKAGHEELRFSRAVDALTDRTITDGEREWLLNCLKTSEKCRRQYLEQTGMQALMRCRKRLIFSGDGILAKADKPVFRVYARTAAVAGLLALLCGGFAIFHGKNQSATLPSEAVGSRLPVATAQLPGNAAQVCERSVRPDEKAASSRLRATFPSPADTVQSAESTPAFAASHFTNQNSVAVAMAAAGNKKQENTTMNTKQIVRIASMAATGVVAATVPVVPRTSGANVLTDGQALTVGVGQSVEITNETATIPYLVDNGALTLKSGTALTLNGSLSTVATTNQISASLTLEAGSSLNIVGPETATLPENTRFAVGRFGGTGTVTVASGAALTVSGTRFNVSWNADSNAARVLPTFGRLVVAGSVTAPYLQCAGFFVQQGYPPYDFSSYPYVSDICLEEGGVLAVRTFQYNDKTRSTIHFNGGTLKMLMDNPQLFRGTGGLVDMIIADGKNAVVDTDGHNVVLFRNSDTNLNAFMTLSGTGGLVKKGEGCLALAFNPGCNTFTGPITVEKGVLSLGRPLAEGQTVTVCDGGTFVPYDAGDNAKITRQEGMRELYVVTTNTVGGVDLLGLSGSYYADRLGGPLAGASATLSGTVTHAEATVANPFKLIGLGSGTLTLQDTGLESIPALVSGIGTIAFTNDRVLTSSQKDYLQIAEGAAYKQIGSLRVGSEYDSVALTVTGGMLSATATIYAGAMGGTGTISVLGGKVACYNLMLGANIANNRRDSSGTVVVSNATVSLQGMVDFSMSSLNDGKDYTTVKNLMRLEEGATLSLFQFYRHDDPRARIFFNGGIVKAVADANDFFLSNDKGTLESYAASGKNILVDTAEHTLGLNSGAGYLLLTGEGGFIKRGSGTLRLGPSQKITMNYAGDTVVEAGTLMLNQKNILPDGTGTGILQINSGATFDMAGYDETLNAMQNNGTLTNSGATAMLVFGSDGRSWTESENYPTNITLGKAGTGTMLLKTTLRGGLSVQGGTALVVMTNAAVIGFPHYRFKIEGVKSPNDVGMQFSEIKLLCDGVDVTARRSGITYDSSYSDSVDAAHQNYPASEVPERAVDGYLVFPGGVASKYLDFRIANYRSATDAARVWLGIDFAAPQRVTHYTWATGNDATNRDPASWRFQGSVDGKEWVDLDVCTGFYAPDTPRSSYVGTNFVCTFPANVKVQSGYGSSASAVTVASGATLALEGTEFTTGTLDSRGTISLQDNAVLTCASPLAQDSIVSGRIAGNGKLVIAGSNVVVLVCADAYTGDTVVKSGTLCLATPNPAKWFRLTFKKTRNNEIFQISEFSLFDASGARQNLNLTEVADGTAATNLAAGTFACAKTYKTGSGNETADKIFDNSTSTKWCMNEFSLNNEADTNVWLILSLRLADTAKEITGYNFTTANDASGRNPVSWSLESSTDGVNWQMADSKSAVESPSTYFTLYNNGVPYPCVIAMSYSEPSLDVLPRASVVEVRTNATLAISGADALIGALRVDCAAGGGTITTFNPAANGALYLTNVSSKLDSYRIPLTIGALNHKENLHTWKVYVNGELKKQYQFVWKDGRLMLASCGTVVMLM